MTNTLSANDLKTKGVSAINSIIREKEEALITIRGKNTYVVMPIERYNYYRECELDSAIMETGRDLKEGKYITESITEHIKRITK